MPLTSRRLTREELWGTAKSTAGWFAIIIGAPLFSLWAMNTFALVKANDRSYLYVPVGFCLLTVVALIRWRKKLGWGEHFPLLAWLLLLGFGCVVGMAALGLFLTLNATLDRSMGKEEAFTVVGKEPPSHLMLQGEAGKHRFDAGFRRYREARLGSIVTWRLKPGFFRKGWIDDAQLLHPRTEKAAPASSAETRSRGGPMGWVAVALVVALVMWFSRQHQRASSEPNA
jgi:hypothetical protein